MLRASHIALRTQCTHLRQLRMSLPASALHTAVPASGGGAYCIEPPSPDEADEHDAEARKNDVLMGCGEPKASFVTDY